MADLALTVKNQGPGVERLDLLLLSALRQQVPALSRAAIKTLFKEKRVGFADGRLAHASDQLPPGSYPIMIRNWDAEELASAIALPAVRGSFLPVLYENEELLILHKSSGVPSVPHAGEETETAVSSALAHFPALSRVANDPLEPGLLHRLDTGTSGILAFAKTTEEFERLRALWKSGAVQKHYRAIVQNGDFPKLPLELRYFLGHDAQAKKRMIATADPSDRRFLNRIRGKALPTVTHVLSAKPVSGEHLDLQIQIETGAMHQIRCSLAALGFPIVGDSVYRGTASNRLWLHAWKLLLPLKSGVQLGIEASLPSGWPV